MVLLWRKPGWGDANHDATLGLSRNVAEAIRWYRLAAAQGHSGAQFALGVMYEAGDGVERDEATALAWFKSAAEKQSPKALRRIGDACRDGKLGLTKDDELAVLNYRKAAATGLIDANNNLGWMLERGRGTPRDEGEALRLYHAAAEHGSAFAQNRLGLAYRNSDLGVTQDDKAAIYWFRLAADQGFPDAQENLAIMYAAGRGVEKDDKEALNWHRLAAEHGNPIAEVNLGTFYWAGRGGLAKDRAEAVRHYLVAANKGVVEAQRMVEIAYRTGDGVERDITKMLYWARKAAEQGDAWCENSLGYSILSGLDDTYDFVEATTWLILAVERSPPGELHDRAVVNLTNARAQLTDTEQAEAERGAQQWRDVFARQRTVDLIHIPSVN